MKTIVMIYAGCISEYALKKDFNGLSAFDRVISIASKLDNAEKIVLFTDNASKVACNEINATGLELKVVESYPNNEWTCSTLTSAMAKEAEEFDSIYYGWNDCPFYDVELTNKLNKAHQEYFAEYTFADGYPDGVSMEVIDTGAMKIIAGLAKDNETIVKRDMLFSIMKKDINSFDVETILSTVDYRPYRLSFTCSDKRNQFVCKKLFDSYENNIDALCEKAIKDNSILRTLPAFYNIQISATCSGACTFCAWPSLCKAEYGETPEKLKILAEKSAPLPCANEKPVYMDIEKFKTLVEKILDFSGDSVISLSLWGESTEHPNFVEFVKEILKHSSLSVLIETDGSGINEEMIKEIAEYANSSPERTNAQEKINWIFALDASESEMYKKLHGEDKEYDVAVEKIKLMKKFFPGALYPQFLRFKDNEEELESFYRYWKAEGNGELIIQKYDDLAGRLPNKKVADLTPVIRNSCWHLRRDMNIGIDGNVYPCKAMFDKENIMGNAFDEDLASIWKKGESLFDNHINNSTCRECDEYYTFNF